LTWSAIFSGPCSMVAGKGAFGAALMMEPSLVAECVAAGACSLTICS
jgi:tRNA-dihydrouridine synthase